jgi:hypothetical protein
MRILSDKELKKILGKFEGGDFKPRKVYKVTCNACITSEEFDVLNFVSLEKELAANGWATSSKGYICERCIQSVEEDEDAEPTFGQEVCCHYCLKSFPYNDVTSQVGAGIYWCGCAMNV